MSCFQSHAVAAAGDCWQTSALNATLHASFSFTSARATPTPSVQISPWQLVIVVRVCFMRRSKGIFWVAALSRMSCFVTSVFFFFCLSCDFIYSPMYFLALYSLRLTSVRGLQICAFDAPSLTPAGHTLTTQSCAPADVRAHLHMQRPTDTHTHARSQINKRLHFGMSHSRGQRWKDSLFGLPPWILTLGMLLFAPTYLFLMLDNLPIASRLPRPQISILVEIYLLE